MANLEGFRYLSQEQLNTLANGENVIVGGVIYTPNDLMLYGIPDTDYTNDEIDGKINDAKIIVGTSDPTSSTVGYVGQLYLNSESGANFQCKAIEEEGGVYTYVWEGMSAGIPIEGEW